MGISFTDSQLRTASKDVLDTAQQISVLGQQQSSANDGKTDALAKDQNNKIFFDNYISIIHHYNVERALITGDTITEYDENTLIQSAKQAPGNQHFTISPPWVNFPPKLLAENNGNPTSNVTPNEMTTIPPAQAAINLLENGYADGAIETTLFAAYSTGQPVKLVGSTFYSIGDRVVIDQGGVSLIGTVLTAVAGTGGTPGTCSLGPSYTTQAACLAATPTPGIWTPGTPSPYPQEITISELQGPLGSLGAGARIRNFHPGFNNSEREHSTTPYAPEVRTYFESLIDPALSPWQGKLQAELAALNANDVGGSEATEVSTAKANVQAAIQVYTDFTNAPATGAGVGKFGDTIMSPIIASLTLRLSDGPARASQIFGHFGSVSQNGDGSSSGSGHFYSLWKWIDLRTTKAGGSLTKYYSYDLTTNFLGTTQSTASNKQNEYANVMDVHKLSADTDGTNVVKVQDATGLTNGDTVVILDSQVGHTPVHTTITGVSGLNITLAATVSGITAGDTGRLVKLL